MKILQIRKCIGVPPKLIEVTSEENSVWVLGNPLTNELDRLFIYMSFTADGRDALEVRPNLPASICTAIESACIHGSGLRLIKFYDIARLRIGRPVAPKVKAPVDGASKANARYLEAFNK